MPQYTRQDGDAMRQDAIRRSKEMYHRAFRNQRRSETMIFYRCERNQGQLPAA